MNSATNQIFVKFKNVYGNTLIYPACDKSKTFIRLQGRSTFTNRDIDILKLLGFRVVRKESVCEL